MKDTIRLNFEFPKEYYSSLKMLCAKKGVTLKDHASKLLINSMEEYEDDVLTKKARKRLEELDEDDLIDFEKAVRLAGWYDEKEV